MIGTATHQVDRGVGLVGEAGAALSRIATQIGEIDRVVSEIALGAREQSQTLGEVNAAIGSIDMATQQNAALAEQSTAASHQLSATAEQLMQLMRRFKTGTGAPAPAANEQPARPAPVPARRASSPAVVGNLALKPAEEAWTEF